MLVIQTILPFIFLLTQLQTGNFSLKQDLDKDLKQLSNTSVFISDNTSATPSVQTIAHDLQLFGVIASIELSKSKYNQHTQGRYKIQKWQFPDGAIKVIYQIETTIALDTVVTQRYLERAATQHRIQNKFTFRAYAVSTSSDPQQLYYFTEADQGLLEYRINDRQVQINYPNNSKEGLNDVLPKVEEEISSVLSALVKK